MDANVPELIEQIETAAALGMEIAAPRGTLVWLLSVEAETGAGMTVAYKEREKALAALEEFLRSEDVEPAGLTWNSFIFTVAPAEGSIRSQAQGTLNRVIVQ